MLRLAAYASDGVRRFELTRGEWIVGSGAEAGIHLPYSGVSARHARIRWDGDQAWVEEVPGRRALLVNGRRTRQARLELLDEVRIGPVALLVEEVGGSPATLAATSGAVPAAATSNPAELAVHLARLAGWVLADAPSRGTAEELLGAFLRDLGGGAIFLLRTDLDTPGVKLAVATEANWFAVGPALLGQVPAPRGRPSEVEGGHFRGVLGEGDAWILYRYFPGLDRRHLLLAALPRAAEQETLTAGFAVVASLLVLGLVHHVGRYEPLLPSSSGKAGLRLAPDLLVGESLAVDRLLTHLAAIAPSSDHLVLRGEAGTGKEAWALTVHLSSPRAAAPFLNVSCAGAAPARLEAQLFGATVPGRTTALEREGLLTLADGGTLFVDEVDELPASLQARLVRALRDGEVETPGGGRRRINPRLIVGSPEPLERLAARGRFRPDLAHLLSRFQADVPPIRERRAELPLLVQSLVNRFSRETGKRIQGITVDALASLSRYSYPGNWPELENVVRQLVYLCPSGQAIPRSLLPERVRSAELLESTQGVDQRSDLSLDLLVAATEESAIREALRRSAGNKARAARLLGLSRNGLAMKMSRLSIDG
jgi:DNA-binding NtrC family response regulator